MVTEAITFHQHLSADDSIIQQAISTWQMVLALSQSGVLLSLCLSENCQVNKHTVAEKSSPFTFIQSKYSTHSGFGFRFVFI